MASFNPLSSAGPDAGFALSVNQGAHAAPPMGLEGFDQELAFDDALL